MAMHAPDHGVRHYHVFDTISRAPVSLPSKTEQMFEHLFNISSQISCKIRVQLYSKGDSLGLSQFNNFPMSLTASILYGKYGGGRPFWHNRRQSPVFPPSVSKMTTQQFTPVLPPPVCHFGGRCLLSRRFLRHKIGTSAPISLTPADTNGGNWQNRNWKG